MFFRQSSTTNRSSQNHTTPSIQLLFFNDDIEQKNLRRTHFEHKSTDYQVIIVVPNKRKCCCHKEGRDEEKERTQRPCKREREGRTTDFLLAYFDVNKVRIGFKTQVHARVFTIDYCVCNWDCCCAFRFRNCIEETYSLHTKL